MLQYKKILVPVDFSEISSFAIRKAISATNIYQSKLVLMHVIDYLPPPYVAADVPAIVGSEELMIERAEKYLAKLAIDIHVGDCEKIVRTGRAKKTLVEYIEGNDVDLVVIGAHNHSAMENLLGSTSASVIRSVSCDVLVVHG